MNDQTIEVSGTGYKGSYGYLRLEGAIRENVMLDLEGI